MVNKLSYGIEKEKKNQLKLILSQQRKTKSSLISYTISPPGMETKEALEFISSGLSSPLVVTKSYFVFHVPKLEVELLIQLNKYVLHGGI